MSITHANEINDKIIDILATKYSQYNVPKEDLIQEGSIGYLMASRSLSKIPNTSLFNYAAKAAEYKMIDYCRKYGSLLCTTQSKSVKPLLTKTLVEGFEYDDEHYNYQLDDNQIINTFIQQDELSRFFNKLKLCSPERQEVITLVLQGYTLREIANKLNKSIKTINSLFNRSISEYRLDK